MTQKLLNPKPGDTSPLADYVGNISHCWRCSHCKWVPSPMSNAFAHACPSIQWGGFHAYSGGGKVITAYALKEGEADYSETALESIFACTMCGACDTSCKNNNGELIEPLSVLYALREQVAADGQSLPAHRTMIDNLRETGNAAGHPRSERSRWCEGLEIKDALSEPVDVLLHIGCENAFDQQAWPELRAIVTLLRTADVNFGIAYDAESASGETAFDLGFRGEARALASGMAALIAKSGAATIVTCSANSYAGIRNIWPRLGVAPPPAHLVHVTDFVDRLFETGRLSTAASLDAVVTYHDPCKLGRLSESYTPGSTRWTKTLNVMAVPDGPRQVLMGNEGLYEAPRRLLSRIKGLKLVEMERNRVASYCCGAGGGAKEAYPDFAEFAGNQRLKEAKATGAEIVATACRGCQRHLGDIAASDATQPKIMGIFELLTANVAQPAKQEG